MKFDKKMLYEIWSQIFEFLRDSIKVLWDSIKVLCDDYIYQSFIEIQSGNSRFKDWINQRFYDKADIKSKLIFVNLTQTTRFKDYHCESDNQLW